MGKVGHELDAQVGEGGGGRPGGHEEEGGRGGNGVIFAGRGVKTESEYGKRGTEVLD